MAASATPKSPNQRFEFYGSQTAIDEDSPVAGFPSSQYMKQSKDGSMLDTMESSNHLNFSQKSTMKGAGILGRLESLGESVVNETEIEANKTVREPNVAATSLASISEKGSQCSDVEMQLEDSPSIPGAVESLQNLAERVRVPQSKTSISKLDHIWKLGQFDENTVAVGSLNVMTKMETHQSYLSTHMMQEPQQPEAPKVRKISGVNFDEAPSIEQFQFDAPISAKLRSTEFCKKIIQDAAAPETGSSRKCSVFENSIMEEDLCEEYSDEEETSLRPPVDPVSEDAAPGGSIAEFNDAAIKTKSQFEYPKASKASELSIGEEFDAGFTPKAKIVPGKVSTIFKASFEHLLNGTQKPALVQVSAVKGTSFELSMAEFDAENLHNGPLISKPTKVKVADINKSLENLEANVAVKKVPVLLDIPLPKAEWKVNMALREFKGIDDDAADEQLEEEIEEEEGFDQGEHQRPYQQHADRKTTFDEMFKIGLSCSVISHSKMHKPTQRRTNITNGSIRLPASSRRRLVGGSHGHATTRSWSPSGNPIQTSAQVKLRAIAPGFRRGF